MKAKKKRRRIRVDGAWRWHQRHLAWIALGNGAYMKRRLGTQ